MTRITAPDRVVLATIARRPSTATDYLRRVPVRHTRKQMHDRLQKLEKLGLIERNGERIDGEHVYAATTTGAHEAQP